MNLKPRDHDYESVRLFIDGLKMQVADQVGSRLASQYRDNLTCKFNRVISWVMWMAESAEVEARWHPPVTGRSCDQVASIT